MIKLYNLILLLVIILSANELKAQVVTQDSLALVDFYNSTSSSGWRNHANWLTSSPLSTWYGVTVTANRVTSLSLVYNQLSGDIPVSFGNLAELSYLNLNYNNNLTGSISFLAKLHNLHDIELSINKFSGKIPKLNDPNLSVLNLEGNQLSGNIPVFGKDTASTIVILLDDNHLIGTVNHQFDSLTNLYELYLDLNQLTGSIPASLNQFIKLHEIVFSYNQLTGKLPALDSLKNLQYLFVDNNQLSGKIPSSLNTNTQLLNLDLSYNNFSGKLPSFDSLKQLSTPAIQNNHFTFAGMEDFASHQFNPTYSPQANISITQNGNILSVSAGGTISNNTYNWYKDGVLFKSNVGTPRLVVHKNGNYSVAVTNSIATQLTLYSDTVTVTGLLQNSIAAWQTTDNKLSLYPNPAKTNATILFNATGYATIKLTDVEGDILLTKTITANGKTTVQLDVSKYASGVYYVSVMSDGKQAQTIKLIKE